MNTPLERLQLVIKNEKLKNVTNLAKEVGYNQSSISRIVLGKWKNINRNLAGAIVKRYPHYSIGWLLTGEGEMFADSQDVIDADDKEKQRLNEYLPTHKATNERERLQIVIDNEGLKTATGLAKAIGYNQSNLSKVMTGRWGMNANLAAAVNRVYPQYSVAWLMTGEDDNAVMVEEKSVQEVGSNRRGAKFLSDDHGQLYIQVPHVPYAARAEFANISDTLEPYREEWGTETYEADKRASGLYLSFDVKGDSMDDGSRGSLQDGDKVLVRELERDDWRNPLKYRDHPFWVVVFGSSVLIKQIISEDMESGTITFHSLNPSPEYCDFTLNIDDIRSLYYVIRVKPKSFAL